MNIYTLRKLINNDNIAVQISDSGEYYAETVDGSNEYDIATSITVKGLYDKLNKLGLVHPIEHLGN